MSRRTVSLTALLTVGLVLPLLAAPSATAASSSIDDLFVCAGHKRTTWQKALDATTHTTTVALRTLGL